jgi:hypothetical protein
MYFHKHVNFLKFGDFGSGCTFWTDSPRIKSRGNGGVQVGVVKEQLAGGARARTKRKSTSQVPKQTVDAWIKKAKTSFGIRSIICLLAKRQLRLYADPRMDLVSYYRVKGFQVVHIPVRNYKRPALSDRELEKVWRAYQRLEKLVLLTAALASAGLGEGCVLHQAKVGKKM